MFQCMRNIMVVGAAALLGLASLVYAEAPMVKTQVPGYYRINLGLFEITALYDGVIELDATILKNVKPAELNRLLARMFVAHPKMPTAVNAYLVNTGTQLVLIDTGAATHFGPTLGHVAENLKAAGYDPSRVDIILITHMHGDHIGGLNDADGKPIYPNAKIFVAKAENDFWLSQKAADSAPAKDKPFFKLAHDVTAPYLANGKWQTFPEGSELIPGIRTVEAKGHTPGHTAYAVESQGQKLLIWGDLVHAHAVQFSRPGVSIEFDIDQKQAIATRRSIMKLVAADKSLVAGMHLPLPGIGHVRADGKGSYTWVPIEFGPLPTTAPPK